MGTKDTVLRNISNLLSCERDESVVATLVDIKERVTAMPDQHVSKDLNTLLHLLVDVKNDNAQLWVQIVQLKEQMDADQARISKLEDTVRDLKTTISTQGCKLAMRQVLHAVNEKLLRRAAAIAAPDLPLAQFWSKYKVRNVGEMKYEAALLDAWESMSSDFGLFSDPRRFWDYLRDLKGGFDAYVHDGSFPRLSVEELTAAAEGSLEDKDRPAFLDMLRLSVRLSEGGSIYDY